MKTLSVNYQESRLAFTFLILLLSFNFSAQNVGINSTGAAPDVSAMLDVAATNKGVLVPRVALTSTTDVTTILTPAISLLVYNTATTTNVTPGYYYWDGSLWQPIASSSSILNFTSSQIFNYTGSDQTFTIPLGARWLRVHAWGGGSYAPGGYSEAVFDLLGSVISPGDVLSIMVGQKGQYVQAPGAIASCAYGFGGDGISFANEGYAGGGLSGIFTGALPILVTNVSRVIVIAGGAGGFGDNQAGSTGNGTVGNDPDGGGMPTFQGVNATLSGRGGGGGGGGGGYKGGAIVAGYIASPGRGGSGFVHGSALIQSIQHIRPVAVQISPPPAITVPLYVSPAGAGNNLFINGLGPNGNGLVIIEWSFY